MSSEILSLIDSTVPQIWLPRPVCDSFEQAFGLTYDPTTDLYLVNDKTHNQLLGLNPSITFALGNTNNPANMTNIVFPYAAFDLQATYPIYSNSTRYFPIRRAANNTQYTLGRTFLQEAYVIADYERSNFSVHQALFQSPMPAQNIVAIPAVGAVSNTTIAHTNHTLLSTGAIAGIVVGGIIAIILLIALGLCYFRFRRRRGMADGPAIELESAAERRLSRVFVGEELMSEERHEMQNPAVYYEMALKDEPVLMSDDNPVYELAGNRTWDGRQTNEGTRPVTDCEAEIGLMGDED